MSPKSRSRKVPKKKASTKASPAPDRRGPVVFSAEERAALTPRYTPPLVLKRHRPGWHRWTGWAQVAVGIALVLLNYAQDFGPRLLPGGHSELYFLLGLMTAGGGSWWLGVFDRPQRQLR